MFNLIKESFNITNKYLVLATPLILFSLISSLYLLFSTGGNLISIIFALILFFLMLCAFLSGWFYMIKKCVSNPETEDINVLLAEFPAGVGEYFLSVLGMIMISSIVLALFGIISTVVGLKIIGDVGISAQALTDAMASTETLKSFLLSLNEEQLIKINAWNMLVLFTMLVSYMVLLFYSPALFFKDKNPFKAFVISLKDFFSKKFFKNVLLFLFIFFTYFLLSMLSAGLNQNIIANFVFTLINFYYLVFVAVYLYNHYYLNYVKIGSNIDTTV